MNIIVYLYTVMDAFLMPFFRYPESPLIGYWLGISVLSMICLLIGEASISLAFNLNKEKIVSFNNDIGRFQNLSISALKAGDKEAYRACNSIANETFGKSFFSQITLSAASLWPLFIALGWMQYRFGMVSFKVYSISFGYLLSFLLCYIAARILFSRIRKLAFYKSMPAS